MKEITFSFGKNWKSYLNTVSEGSLSLTRKDILEWLPAEDIKGKRILDIGSGSGVHSLVFNELGARELVSFDYDPFSVEATTRSWSMAGKPVNWRVMHGSVLDKEFLAGLGPKFDIVYSWGVLHHTGSMWKAIENAATLVGPGGKLWIALYVKGPKYEDDLALKKRYNAASWAGKKWMEWKFISRHMQKRLFRGANPFKWNQKLPRGMNVYHDIVDWLGGLPYEVASAEEIRTFISGRGFEEQKSRLYPEGSNNIYLYVRK